tara:strand:- start:49750 stop:50436 length:687 start_codon:yes stop_codon:yes gene_type:complete
MENIMNESIQITSSDGHSFDAYMTSVNKDTDIALVILQEIFGVNQHIRSVCESFTKVGYTALAPALFDRVKPGIELGYGSDDIEKGRNFRSQLGWDDALTDIDASINFLSDNGYSKIAVIGYCWGGSLAYLSSCRLNINASVGYYGGQIINFVDELPKCPVMLHFGSEDHSIPLSDIETLAKKHPEILTYVYKEAGHGFNCDLRTDYNLTASNQALSRTLAHLNEHLS